MAEEKVFEQMQPRPETNKVCAVIVTYQIGAQIHHCVNSVRDQVGAVTIVDNGSTKDTLEALRELEAQQGISVIYNHSNLGVAHALNQGVQYATSQGYRRVLTLDHDSEATPGMVAMLARTLDSLGDKAGIVAANAFDRNAQVFLGRSPGPDDEDVIETKASISSGCLIDVRVFEKVGFFNELLFVYHVDTDFCFRVRRSGLKIYLCPGAVLLHSEGLKERRRFLWRRALFDAYGKEARYYIARNAIYMLRNYSDDLLYCYQVASRLLKDSVKVLLFDRERAVKMTFIMKGLWDGLRGRYGPMDPTRR